MTRPAPARPRVSSSAAIPLCRYGTPEEFGKVAAFLLSPAASDGGALRGL
ncbi:hypothetical protein [Kitasatospora sp. McL0602]